MNYKYQRAAVEDVLIVVTTRTLRDSPARDSDLARAKQELQMLFQMQVKVIALALGRHRSRISSQMQDMTSYGQPVILSGYKKLLRGEGKVVDVMEGICPPVYPGSRKFFFVDALLQDFRFDT